MIYILLFIRQASEEAGLKTDLINIRPFTGMDEALLRELAGPV